MNLKRLLLISFPFLLAACAQVPTLSTQTNLPTTQQFTSGGQPQSNLYTSSLVTGSSDAELGPGSSEEINNDASSIANVKPVRPRIVFTQPVTNNGRIASELTGSLKNSLHNAGYQIISRPEQAYGNTEIYLLKPKIEAQAIEPGKEQVSIEWQVLTPSGEPVGKVSQKRAFETDMSAEGWQHMRVLAAAAATEGLDRLIAREVKKRF